MQLTRVQTLLVPRNHCQEPAERSVHSPLIHSHLVGVERHSNPQRGESHQPVGIMGKRNKAVLISEEDWTAIQETLFLLSVPGMRESIREGMDTPVEECDKELDW